MPPAGPEDELPQELADRAAEELLATAEPDRGAVLATLIARHPQYRMALERLRAELASADRLLAGAWPDAPAGQATHVGGHRIVRRLGEGAFGIVFLCAQEQPVVRQVAVKVLRPGAGDAKTLRRFSAERQLLAQLNHPSITQVFDAGVLPDGRPYFVMEYVDGTPFRRYCDDRGLGCRKRLRLFAELCHGVAHAHKRGIVHRDLKPANVLVVESDRGPVPKIIDFGIAKALFASDTGEGPRTDAGRVIGTPGYMSPEQAAGRTDEIDERADVFALGVMLYELLTGELPWARGATTSDSEPVRPSVRVTTSTASVPAAAASQRRQLAAELRGDLDWITLRALARERAERYQTATALATDVERHLRGEPVSVGPPSAMYRLRKLVRRNRPLVATLAAAAVLLGAAAMIVLAYGRSAEAAEAEATAVVQRLLDRANDPRLRDAPRSDGVRRVLMEEALSCFERLRQERPADPALSQGRCQALLSLSEVHRLLGEPGRAVDTAQEAEREIAAALAQAPESLELRGLRGEALRKQGRALADAANHAGARTMFLAAAGELAKCAERDPEHYGRMYAMDLREAASTIAPHLHQERIAALRDCLRVVEDLQQAHPQLDGLPADHAQVCVDLAHQLTAVRSFAEADGILTRAERDLPRITTERDDYAYQAANERAVLCWLRDDRPAALRAMQGAVEFARAAQRAQPQRLRPQQVLAQALRKLGQQQNYVDAFAESAAAYRDALARFEAMAREFSDNPICLVDQCATLREFAQVLWDRFRREDLAEAKACAAKATAVNDLIPEEADTGRQPRWQLLAMQAGIADSLGEPEAEALWQQVEAAMPASAEERARQEQVSLLVALTGLARWQIADGRPEAAAATLAAARERIAALRPVADKCMVEVGWLEARLAVARGDHAEAAAAAGRILAARSTWFGVRRAGDCWHAAWRCALAAHADADTIADYHKRAAEQYERVLATLRDDVTKDPRDPWYVLPWGFASVRRAELLAASGEEGKARELLAAALPKLEAVRELCQVDQWDPAAFQDGQHLQQRLEDGR